MQEGDNRNLLEYTYIPEDEWNTSPSDLARSQLRIPCWCMYILIHVGIHHQTCRNIVTTCWHIRIIYSHPVGVYVEYTHNLMVYTYIQEDEWNTSPFDLARSQLLNGEPEMLSLLHALCAPPSHNLCFL